MIINILLYIYNKNIMDLNFDLIYNINKLENIINPKEEKEEINENTHKCNYICDNSGLYVCTICGEINYEMTKISDGIDNEKINSYHPIDNTETIKLKGIKNKQLNNLATRYNTTIDYEKKELFKIMNEINKYCTDLGIQKNIADDAQLIYQNVIKIIKNDKSNKFIKARGRNNGGLKGACIYYACLKNGILLTISKIAKSIDNLKQSYIHKECRIINKLIENYPELKIFIPITCFYYPYDYLQTMVRCFNITKKSDINNIKKMLLYIQYDKLIPNHNPLSQALSVCLVYLVYKGYMKPNFAKKDVAKYFSISQPTVCSAYKELQAKQSKILNYCLNHTEDEINEYFKKSDNYLDENLVNELRNKMMSINRYDIPLNMDYIKSLI